jgi:hypothetical protein
MANLTPLSFMEMLTLGEQGAITAAAMQSPQLMLWLLKLTASTEVVLGDPRTAGGLTAMVQAGLLTQARHDELVSALTTPPRIPRHVVGSEAILGVPQADGRFWVTEAHTLDDGSVITNNLLCDADFDYESAMAEHAANLNSQLIQEAAANG